MTIRRYFSLGILGLFAAALGNNAFALESDQVPAGSLANAHVKSKLITPHAHLNGQAHARHGIPFVDSLVNWNDHYFADGFDSFGNPNREWYTNTVGIPPQNHGTTFINAPIVPVIMDLRNFDGSPRFVGGHRLISDPTPFVQPVLDSPVFSNASFTSSPVPTQVTDAVQRAEYFDQAKDDWHTLLSPSVKAARTMVLIRGTYRFALNGDGSCCLFILVNIDDFVNALFPATATDTTTPVGAAENAGDITTKDMSSFLFPNTFLYFNNDPSQCCVLGFHTYDFEPANPNTNNTEKRYVLNYSSWITAGLFGPGFTDITALSHEIAETFNDPFVTSDGVHDITPWWMSANGQCQNALEDGDVIEGLPNATFPTLMPNGFVYHPQNEALLQWFQRQFPSSAIHGAYSYPDETILPTLSPPNLKPADCGF